MQQTLNEDFLCELAKYCLRNQNILEVCKTYLEYQYLPTENWKKIFKGIFDFFEVHGKVTTVGVLGQEYEGETGVNSLLARIKEVNIADNKDQILEQFEKFIKKRKFMVYHEKLANLFNEGKHDEAYKLASTEGEELHKFTIKENFYQRVFEDFDVRMAERLENSEDQIKTKIPTGIPPLDRDTYGGLEKGYAMCIVMQSGVGKSTMMRWLGFSAARAGYKVAHFSSEGTEKQILAQYDSGWTGTDLHEIKAGLLDASKMKSVAEAKKQFVSSKGEIYVKCFETFGEASIEECRTLLIEWEKIYGKMDLVIFDYFDEFKPMKKGKYSAADDQQRNRKKDSARAIVNIATEFDTVVVTATQASTVDRKDLNDPNFVMTRFNISELKATVNAFSYVITGNQTEDEYKKGIVRLYTDKMREYRSQKIYKLFQARDVGRFINVPKTIAHFQNK